MQEIKELKKLRSEAEARGLDYITLSMPRGRVSGVHKRARTPFGLCPIDRMSEHTLWFRVSTKKINQWIKDCGHRP